MNKSTKSIKKHRHLRVYKIFDVKKQPDKSKTKA